MSTGQKCNRLSFYTNNFAVNYWTIICGAEHKTTKVAIMVNSVNIIKQNLSITMAANFQSLIMSASSSFLRILLVINCISFSMSWRSLCAIEHVPESSSDKATAPPVLLLCWWAWCILEVVDVPRMYALFNVAEVWPPGPRVQCLKSSSMSSTLANRLFEERSCNSICFILLLIRIVFNVILRFGLLIRKIHGSHCRNIARVYLMVTNTVHLMCIMINIQKVILNLTWEDSL